MMSKKSHSDMRKAALYILLFPSLLLICGCNKEPDAAFPKEKVVNIRTSVESGSSATKGHITGTSLSNYGIFVCLNGTTDTPHKANSWNLSASYNSTEAKWKYYYVSNLTTGALGGGVDSFTLTEREDGLTADLYAYAPYRQDAFNNDPTRIPYSLDLKNGVLYYDRDIRDLLYATQNGTSNMNLDPSSTDPLEAEFTFRHAFALLVFNFRLLHSGNTCRIVRATISKNPDYTGEPKANLYISGTFNAITGTFNDDAVPVQSFYSHSADYHTNVSSTSSEVPLYMMIVPTEFNDNELTITFDLNGQDSRSLPLMNADVRHSDNTAGFKSGYVYNFHYTIDNYVRFDGITVNENWPEVDLGSTEI